MANTKFIVPYVIRALETLDENKTGISTTSVVEAVKLCTGFNGIKYKLTTPDILKAIKCAIISGKVIEVSNNVLRLGSRSKIRQNNRIRQPESFRYLIDQVRPNLEDMDISESPPVLLTGEPLIKCCRRRRRSRSNSSSSQRRRRRRSCACKKRRRRRSRCRRRSSRRRRRTCSRRKYRRCRKYRRASKYRRCRRRTICKYRYSKYKRRSSSRRRRYGRRRNAESELYRGNSDPCCYKNDKGMNDNSKNSNVHREKTSSKKESSNKRGHPIKNNPSNNNPGTAANADRNKRNTISNSTESENEITSGGFSCVDTDKATLYS